MPFDPDKYLSDSGGFDPDAYLGSGSASIFAKGPLKIGKDAFGDTFKEELAKQPGLVQSLVGFGTAISKPIEAVKQIFNSGDNAAIEANKIMEHNAPVASFLGNAATMAIPFGMAGNSLKAAAAIGAGAGLLDPVENAQNGFDVAKGKAINTALGAATGVAGQALANKAGEYISKRLAEIAARRAQGAPIDNTLKEAFDAGLVVPPSSVNPSYLNTLKEGIAGKIATAQVASNRNAPVIDSLAKKAVGLADNAPLTSEAMQQIRSQAYNNGYAPIAGIGNVNTDNAFSAALDRIIANRKAAANSFPNAVKDEITPFIDSVRVNNFDAGDALKMSQLLRDAGSSSYQQGNKDLGAAQKSVAKAIEDQIERHLEGQGQNGAELLQQFRDARTLMAKAHTVEDAIVEGGGTINARKLAQRAQAGKPLSGDLATIGNFANNFPKATQPAQQVGGPGVNKLSHLAALLAGGGAGLAGGPVVGLATAGAAEALPPLMRARLLSNAVQSGIAESKYAPRLDSKLARLLQYSPVAGTVLGLNALGQ